LKILATGGLGAAATASPARASEGGPSDRSKAVAMLYDSSMCTGCKACVAACTEANNLPPDTRLSGGIWQMPLDLNSETKNIIKVFQDPAHVDGFAFVKRQCMHCLDPACVAACPFHALDKDEKGVVTWDGSLCIGCRYCEVACPFEVPKFEWDRFNPKIVKCEFCNHRLEAGLEPGCTAVCPTKAVVFGTRDDLLARAKQRIADNPGRYSENRVYGETDAGGTQVLYLSHVPFAFLGLPEVRRSSLPEYASRIHRRIYKWMLGPVAMYALLVGVMRRRWKVHEEETARQEAATGLEEQL
jgi:formate dehydrogenase beta subunit